jgi:O-antigen ligase
MKSSHHRMNALLIGALYLYGFSLPLSKSISSLIVGLIYAFTLGIFAFNTEFRIKIIKSLRQPLTLPIGLYLGVLCFGLLFSQDLREGISVVKQAANLFFVYLMISVLLDAGKDDQSRILHGQTLLFSFLMGIFVLDLIGFLTYGGIIGNKKYILPVTPFNMHHIWFGNLNAVCLFGAVSLFLFPSHKRTLMHHTALWLFVPVALVSLLLSTSRTAWLGALCSGSVFLYFLVKKKKTFFLLSTALLAGCVAVYFISDIVRARIDQVYMFLSGQPDISLGARFIMWKASVSMFVSNPLYGVGTGDYKSTISSFIDSGQYPDILGKYNQPHNMYLFTLATNGILGFSALLFFFYRILRNTKILLQEQEKFFGFLALTVSIHFLIAGLTESLFNIHVLISCFAVLMGISQRIYSLRESRD